MFCCFYLKIVNEVVAEDCAGDCYATGVSEFSAILFEAVGFIFVPFVFSSNIIPFGVYFSLGGRNLEDFPRASRKSLNIF
jgi:hypothetical protein